MDAKCDTDSVGLCFFFSPTPKKSLIDGRPPRSKASRFERKI